jgi:hypothetical protein
MRTAVFVLIGITVLWAIDQVAFGGFYMTAATRMATAMRAHF